MSAAVEACPCGEGSGGPNWHRRRGQEPCAKSTAAKTARDAARYIARLQERNAAIWVPGSAIRVPEHDPL